MVRVVIDPGVLIAAAITPLGVCGRVLNAVLDRRCSLIVSPLLIAELEEVLLRPKFRRYLSEEDVRQYVRLIAEVSDVQPDVPTQPGVTPDPDDDYLVALAQNVVADMLVSGDPHLTGLSNVQPPVLAPRALLELLDSLDAGGRIE